MHRLQRPGVKRDPGGRSIPWARIAFEAVSGGVSERKAWIKDSGHFQVGNLAKMSTEERKKMVDDMLPEGN